MAGYQPIDLSGLCNAGAERLGGRAPAVGAQMFHGLPFLIGDPADPLAPCFIVLEPGTAVTVPARRAADHVVVAHRRLPGGQGGGPAAGPDGGPAVGSAVAEYTFLLAGAQAPAVTAPVRERLEIAIAPEEGWDVSGPFLAASSARLRLADRYRGRWDDLGMRQCESVFAGLPDYFLWVWENPQPAVPVESIRLVALTAPVLVAAITVGTAGEYPFPREAARSITITALGPDGPAPLRDPAVLVDRGVASYAFRLRGHASRELPGDSLKGLGRAGRPRQRHGLRARRRGPVGDRDRGGRRPGSRPLPLG